MITLCSLDQRQTVTVAGGGRHNGRAFGATLAEDGEERWSRLPATWELQGMAMSCP